MMRVSILTGLFSLLGMPSSAQVVTDYKPDNVSGLAIAMPDIHYDVQPDTTGLWYHIEQQQKRFANQEFERLRDAYPRWQPEETLLLALASLNEEHLAQTLTSVQPDHSRTDSKSLFEQLAAMSEEEREVAGADFLRQAHQQANESQNADFHALLGWTYLHQRAFSKAVVQFEQSILLAPSSSAAEGSRLAVLGQVNAALAEQNISLLSSLRSRYPDMDIGQQVIGHGWALFDSGHYAQALHFFELEEEVEGQVLALSRLGKLEQASAIACQNVNQKRLSEHCANYWSLQQAERFDRGHYAQSMRAALKIQQVRPLTFSETELVAWSAFQTQQFKQADDTFRQLLSGEPANEDFAQALLSITPRDEYAALAQSFPVIAKYVNQRRVQQAWQRKQFILAGNGTNSDIAAAFPDDVLPHRQGLSVYARMQGRQRSGEPGLGNFDVTQGNVGLSNTIEQWRWDIRLDYEQLYSGRPQQGSWFGDGITGTIFNSITGFEDTGLHASLQYEMPSITLYGELNYALISQPVPAKLTGQLSASWFLDDAVTAINLYRLRVTDSLLSMGATYFEASAEAFGGIHKTGIRALYSQQTGLRNALSLSVVADSYKGKFASANQHAGLRLDFSHDTTNATQKSLDYFRLGPYVSWEGFDKNLSGFTRGHGGYFSPENMWSTGVYAELLTREGSNWQGKVALNAGYNWIEEARSARFPLDVTDNVDNKTDIRQSTNQGLAGQVTLEGQYQITGHWLVAGYFQQAYAVEYQSTSAGIELRWHAGRTKGVTSDTLLLNDAALAGFVF